MESRIKYLVLSIYGLTIGIIVNAQTNLGLDYNSTGSGTNISVNISKVYKSKHELGFGLRMNTNRIKHLNDQSTIFRKRLYATKAIHFFGVEANYEKRIFDHWTGIMPFMFYRLQVTYSTTINPVDMPTTVVNDIQLYQRELLNYGPFTWLEAGIGVGFKARINENWFIKQRIGIGPTFIVGNDDDLPSHILNNFTWEIGEVLSVGLGYSFNKNQNK